MFHIDFMYRKWFYITILQMFLKCFTINHKTFIYYA